MKVLRDDRTLVQAHQKAEGKNPHLRMNLKLTGKHDSYDVEIMTNGQWTQVSHHRTFENGKAEKVLEGFWKNKTKCRLVTTRKTYHQPTAK